MRFFIKKNSKSISFFTSNYTNKNNATKPISHINIQDTQISSNTWTKLSIYIFKPHYDNNKGHLTSLETAAPTIFTRPHGTYHRPHSWKNQKAPMNKRVRSTRHTHTQPRNSIHATEMNGPSPKLGHSGAQPNKRIDTQPKHISRPKRAKLKHLDNCIILSEGRIPVAVEVARHQLMMMPQPFRRGTARLDCILEWCRRSSPTSETSLPQQLDTAFSEAGQNKRPTQTSR